MLGINKAIILGTLGADPEIRFTQSGGKMANLSLATSEYWKDKATGEAKQNTEWHRVVVYNDKIVNAIEAKLTKGSKAYVEGRIKTRKWQDKAGVDRYTTEIIADSVQVVMSKADATHAADTYQEPVQVQTVNDIVDDDIPF